MSYHRSSWISLLKSTLHRAIQKAPIPRRNLLNIGSKRSVPSAVINVCSDPGSVVVIEGFVMSAPLNDRRVMPKLNCGRGGLSNRLGSDRAGISPLKWKILKK